MKIFKTLSDFLINEKSYLLEVLKPKLFLNSIIYGFDFFEKVAKSSKDKSLIF